MARRFVAALSTLVLLVAMVPGASAVSPPDPRASMDLVAADTGATAEVDRGAAKPFLGTGSETRTYLIRLTDDPAPSYRGGKPGFTRTAPRGLEKLDPDSPAVRAYQRHLVEAQAKLIDRAERAIGRSVQVPFTYQFAVNGIAAVLTPAEAAIVAEDSAVASIALDVERELHTDHGPQWENADALWNAAIELGLPANYRGEGIVIGTIDTGVSPGNSSFADVGGDGYDHTNPLGSGTYLGVCNPANPASGGGFDVDFPCNDKLIGAYVFGGANPNGNSALDYDGHGSHTASTSGGNVVNDVVVTTASGFETTPFDISGVAPHANVVAYLGCCTLAGLTASIEQAIEDEVDVINYSIGSSAPSAAWDDFDTVGFLNARAAGIFVATSNGNDGPGVATTGSPADAPWIMSVGASTHNRHNGNALTGLTGSAGPLADMPGKSATGALATPTSIIDAASVGDEFCETTTGHEAEFGGRIVICVRGVNGRVEKSENVAAQGAAGFVLTNDGPHGDSLLGDAYALPGVFISFANGQALRAWLASGTDHVATIVGTTFTIEDGRGDIMASFSSRGPNRAMDTIVPSVTAPGVDILAALGPNAYDANIHGFISGTSMASPHAAGAGALLAQARPDWSPAQAQSALMTTARTTVVNHDGQPASPFAQGSGHIDVGAAVRAGLLFDESVANYLAANPADGGDPKSLNLPSFADSSCLETCSWSRTATVPASADGPVPSNVTWTASATSDAGLTIGVSLSPATVSPGDSMAITVSANVAGAAQDTTLFGRITLTPSNASVPTVTMPLAVVPTSGVLPGAVEVDTRRDAGSYVVSGIQSIGVTDFTGSILGLVEGTQTVGSLNQDATRDDPYDDLSQVGVHLVTVPAGATRLVVETLAAEMPDLDMFIGQGSTPSLGAEVCTSTSSGSVEHCDIANPGAGTWWILVQNWEGSDAQPDSYTLSSAVVPGTSLGNGGVQGPAGTVPAGELYDIRVHWDEPAMSAGDVWYGTVVLGSSPSSPGDIGSFPLTIHRLDDDVTKAASVETATRGDTVSYSITIQPNVTPEDLLYTIVDTVPDGLTIDPASVTGGGVVAGQTITWQIEMPSSVGQTGSYVASTPGDSAQCAANAGFLDLATLGIPFAPLDGDTVAANAFSAIGPFELYGQQFTNLVVAEDGIVTVAGGYGGSPWVAQSIPDPDLPNGVFATLWSDLELSLANGRGMRLAQSTAGGVAIIQWDDAFEFTGDATVGPSVGKFQAWIYNSVSDARPELTFEYGALGALPSTATIGVENITGTLATALLNANDPSTVLQTGGSICLDYVAPKFDPVTVGYDVTIDQASLEGTLTNHAVHVTNDPFAEAAVASDSVEVGLPAVASVRISPSSLKLKPGDIRQLTATATFADGSTANVTAIADWSTSDARVVTVSSTGLARAVAGGKINVTATIGGKSATASIQVTGKKPK